MKRSRFLTLAVMVVLGLLASSAEAVKVPGGKSISTCQTITKPGAYYLLDNLDATGDCIVIVVDDVTFNFNGYRIRGDGTGSCITDGGNSLNGIVILNGTARECDTGINLDSTDDGKIEEMRVLNNTSRGIQVGDRWIIKNNVVVDNGGDGIHAEDRILVLQNVVRNNGCHGILVEDESVIEQNMAQSNGSTCVGGDGIHANGDAPVIKNNSCSDNDGDGIQVNERGAVIIANACRANGEHGIFVDDNGAAIHNNSAVNNGDDGFHVNGTPCTMTGNVATGNGDEEYSCSCTTENNAGGDCT